MTRDRTFKREVRARMLATGENYQAALLSLREAPPARKGRETDASLRPGSFYDKTLVVWAAPANLTQRGGSALTIEDPRDDIYSGRFDAIVLGEVAEGRWMAGSDDWRRTLWDQASVPKETARPDTLVQVAVAYCDNQVSVDRNGQLISQHPMKERREFGPESVVLFGKRHRNQGYSAHFAGEIEDARIYDVALSLEQLQELRPNASSTPAPWAWWTFDDPSGKDRTGRFPVVQLTGGATIRHGRLMLDGKDGNMLCMTGVDAIDSARDVDREVLDA